jgi:hypothetical protein
MLSLCDLSLNIPATQDGVLPGRSGRGFVHRWWWMRSGAEELEMVSKSETLARIQGSMALD